MKILPLFFLLSLGEFRVMTIGRGILVGKSPTLQPPGGKLESAYWLGENGEETGISGRVRGTAALSFEDFTPFFSPQPWGVLPV